MMKFTLLISDRFFFKKLILPLVTFCVMPVIILVVDADVAVVVDNSTIQMSRFSNVKRK